jgi:hypothetical protein
MNGVSKHRMHSLAVLADTLATLPVDETIVAVVKCEVRIVSIYAAEMISRAMTP